MSYNSWSSLVFCAVLHWDWARPATGGFLSSLKQEGSPSPGPKMCFPACMCSWEGPQFFLCHPRTYTFFQFSLSSYISESLIQKMFPIWNEDDPLHLAFLVLLCLEEGHNIVNCEFDLQFTPKARSDRKSRLKASFWEKALLCFKIFYFRGVTACLIE